MKVLILKKRKDFVRAAQGIKSVTPSLILQAAPSLSAPYKKISEDICYVGYTATKKIGKAFIRNKAKRRLRAAVAQIFTKNASAKTDYVVISRYKTATTPFETIKQDLLKALNDTSKQLNNSKEPQK